MRRFRALGFEWKRYHEGMQRARLMLMANLGLVLRVKQDILLKMLDKSFSSLKKCRGDLNVFTPTLTLTRSGDGKVRVHWSTQKFAASNTTRYFNVNNLIPFFQHVVSQLRLTFCINSTCCLRRLPLFVFRPLHLDQIPRLSLFRSLRADAPSAYRKNCCHLT